MGRQALGEQASLWGQGLELAASSLAALLTWASGLRLGPWPCFIPGQVVLVSREGLRMVRCCLVPLRSRPRSL